MEVIVLAQIIDWVTSSKVKYDLLEEIKPQNKPLVAKNYITIFQRKRLFHFRWQFSVLPDDQIQFVVNK